jgi:hypothetical protein
MDILPDLRCDVESVFDRFGTFKQNFKKYPYGYDQKRFFGTMEKF